jgi:predicted AAA+ superfamily ATPase
VIRDDQFETVVTDGVNPPNLDAIDQRLAESREQWATERNRRGGRPDRHNR